MTHVIKIGPKGGKIVGFDEKGRPIYLGDEASSKLKLDPEPGSIAERAEELGLKVGVHPSRHDKARIAWGKNKSDAAHKLEQEVGGLPASAKKVEGSRGGSILMPREVAEKGHSGKGKPAPEPAEKKPSFDTVKAATVPDGFKALSDAEAAQLDGPVTDWRETYGHPVVDAATGEKATLAGWQVSGSPPQKTGKLLLKSASGHTYPRHPGKVKPDGSGAVAQPWHGCAVVKPDTTTQGHLDAALGEQVPTTKAGAKGPKESHAELLQKLHDGGVPAYVMGGLVRDAIRGEQSKDVDTCFAGDTGEAVKALEKAGVHVPYQGGTGLLKVGDADKDDVFEGKPIFGEGLKREDPPQAKKSIGASLARERDYRDFTCNSLSYDPVNGTIIDPTGQGVQDAKDGLLRPPVPESGWSKWISENPTQITRYWKMRAKGYQPANKKVDDFFRDAAKKYVNQSPGGKYSGPGWSVSGSKVFYALGKEEDPKKLKALAGVIKEHMGEGWHDKHMKKWTKH